MTREQAEGVMTVLAEVVEESIKGMEAGLVSKAEQEKVSAAALLRAALVHL
jgi:predicted ATP-grasp superfamily ATP-dependent carboligase